jgi:hypothetical protein
VLFPVTASFSKNVPGELEGSGEEKMDNKVCCTLGFRVEGQGFRG